MPVETQILPVEQIKGPPPLAPNIRGLLIMTGSGHAGSLACRSMQK